MSKEVCKRTAGYETADANGQALAEPGVLPPLSNFDPATRRPRVRPPTLPIDSDALEHSGQIDEDFKRVFAPVIEAFKRDCHSRHPAQPVDALSDSDLLRAAVSTTGRKGALHAEGWYSAAVNGHKSERRAYFHIDPQFGALSKKAVNDAILASRRRADADWLVTLGFFGFESDVDNRNVTPEADSFEVTKVRMHDDLMQDGLIRKDKKAASFVTIGNAADIAYRMLGDDDGADFATRQVFFCGGDHDEFDKFERGLTSLATANAKAKVEKTLKLEIDDEAFERVDGLRSQAIAKVKGRRVAVGVISQCGEKRHPGADAVTRMAHARDSQAP